MSVLTRSKVSLEQLNLLLSFMEEHRDFAAGKQSIYSRFSASRLWRLLAERLNAAATDSDGVRKSPDKWCRYWADIKYKTRKKAAAGGILGELSGVEERLQNILDTKQKSCCGSCSQGDSQADEERKVAPDEDVCSESSGAAGEGARLGTEELLAEAALRAALAAEKQAETVTKGVELLRELVALVRDCLPPPHHHLHPPDTMLQHHHHAL